MTDELIARLRAYPCEYCDTDCTKAADLIEALETQNEGYNLALAEQLQIRQQLEQRVRELEGALKPFAFLEMEKAEGLADTQYVWEAIYLDRVQDWIAFEDIDTARKALGEQP